MASWQPPDDYRNRPVTVLGGGVLGRRIAACWIAAGYDVVLRDPSEKSRNDAVAYVNAELGTFEALIENSRPGKVEATDDLASSVKRSWLVFEAVPEVLKLKEDTFAELERSTPSDCILASNSSSYKSSELVGKIKDETKGRVLNTHYMMPPDALTVELMTDGKTHPALIDFLFDRHKEAGLHPIVALKESTGFVFNRIWAAIKRECLMVLQEGVSTAADIDRVFKEQYGAKDGPCHLMDLVGLDTVEHIERHYIDERGLPSAHADWLHDGFVSSGKLGAKSSKGGLYDKAAPGAETKLFVLNLGMAETLHDGMSFDQIAHRGQVLSLNADQGGKPTQLVGSGYLPDGIDVSTDTKRLYWTQMGTPTKNDGSVLSSNLDGSDIKTIVPEGSVHTPKQCRVDAVNKKLYFCDREGGRVMRVNLDGSEIETLYRTANWQKEPEKLKDEKNWCVGIAPSPKPGKIYWTQKGRSKGSEGRIFSANIDMPRGATAADRTDVELVIGGLPEPIDLELNDDETVLYWTDRGELPLGNTLNMKTVVGPQPESEKALERRILAQGFGEAIGLKFDVQKNAIWVADMAGRIWKCNPDRPAPKEKVFEGATAAFTGLTLIHV